MIVSDITKLIKAVFLINSRHIFYKYVKILSSFGGERGIRTPGVRKDSTVFKTAAFNHSAISPFL